MGLGNIVQRGRAKPPEKARKIEPDRPRLWVQNRILEALVSVKQVTVQPDMWLSPSVLSGSFCPRAWVLAYRMGVPLLDEIGPDNRWWMDGGTAHHNMFQEVWMGPGRIIKGGWECPRCLQVVGIDPDDKVEVVTHGETHIDKVTPASATFCPERCPKCNHKPTWRTPFRYIEPLVYDLDLRVVGWCDGIIDWSPHEDEMWDLKTKASREGMEWVREAPDKSHVKQENWYLDMGGMTYGRIVYVDRTAKHLSDAFIEHPMVHDPHLMAKEKEKVRAFREAAKDSESSIPSCPDGGRTQFGPCQCRDLESAWADSRP